MNRQRLQQVRSRRRRQHVRRRVRGTPLRPRLTVFRSNLHIYAQIIDDQSGQTLVAASTVGSSSGQKYGGNKAAAELVGKRLAEAAKAKGIAQVAFDRGSYKYHGRVKTLADAARAAGLEF
jgi:large subunit ribosomal protein L18